MTPAILSFRATARFFHSPTLLVLLGLISAVAASPAAVTLLSSRGTPPANLVSGNADSVDPVISADGRFVLFSSLANDLVPGDSGYLSLNLFLRDRSSNTTELISANLAGNAGGNDHSWTGVISTNGRYVAFQTSASNLVPGDTNGHADIIVRDRVLGTNVLASVALNGGGAGNGDSSDPAMTPDGRFVAFVSYATNLVAGDTNRGPDIFVRDMTSQTTRLVTVGASGTLGGMGKPVITPDGRYVAYVSSARGLAPATPAASKGEVYLRDLLANTTAWASSNAMVVVSNVLKMTSMPSGHACLSGDGRYVSFRTGWNSGPTSGYAATIIFRYDAWTGGLAMVNTNGYRGEFQDLDGFGPVMTPDGQVIAFVETNRVAKATTVSVWNAATGVSAPVSLALDGTVPTNSMCDYPVLSTDGRFVAFLSSATNLTTNVETEGLHLYLRDLQTGITQLVDADTNGLGMTEGIDADNQPSLSAEGRWIAFASQYEGLISGDNNRTFDVFLHDAQAGTNELVSWKDPGVFSQSGKGLTLLASRPVTPDGQWIVFTSRAEDLVDNDGNAEQDVLLRDMLAGTNSLISVGTDGQAARGGLSLSPLISTNARYVVFASQATNLVAGQTNGFCNLFRRDRWTETSAIVSISTNGLSPGKGNASAPVLSADGRYVAFLSEANNLAPGLTATGAKTFWRDMLAATNVALSRNTISAIAPSMSADGRYVSYAQYVSSSYPAQLVIWDSVLAANIFTNLVGSVKAAFLSPPGNRLAYQIGSQLYLMDLATRSILFTFNNVSMLRDPAQWSADGRFFAFVTTTNMTPGDTNNLKDVYLCDLANGTTLLVSGNQYGSGAANGASDWPAVSGDGRWVTFRSEATDLAPQVWAGQPNLFLYDRFTGSNQWVNVSVNLSEWLPLVSRPVISENGQTLVFQSLQSGLVTGDINRAPDVFTLAVNPWEPMDADGDGIPDDWMTEFFGHATGSVDDLSRPQDDADGDGLSNREEFLTGTDPRSPASVFHLEIASGISLNQGVTLNWQVVPGRSYQVQYKNDLSDSPWLNAPGNAWVWGGHGYFQAPFRPDQGGRYYRIIAVNP